MLRRVGRVVGGSGLAAAAAGAVLLWHSPFLHDKDDNPLQFARPADICAPCHTRGRSPPKGQGAGATSSASASASATAAAEGGRAGGEGGGGGDEEEEEEALCVLPSLRECVEAHERDVRQGSARRFFLTEDPWTLALARRVLMDAGRGGDEMGEEDPLGEERREEEAEWLVESSGIFEPPNQGTHGDDTLVVTVEDISTAPLGYQRVAAKAAAARRKRIKVVQTMREREGDPTLDPATAPSPYERRKREREYQEMLDVLKQLPRVVCVGGPAAESLAVMLTALHSPVQPKFITRRFAESNAAWSAAQLISREGMALHADPTMTGHALILHFLYREWQRVMGAEESMVADALHADYVKVDLDLRKLTLRDCFLYLKNEWLWAVSSAQDLMGFETPHNVGRLFALDSQAISRAIETRLPGNRHLTSFNLSADVGHAGFGVTLTSAERDRMAASLPSLRESGFEARPIYEPAPRCNEEEEKKEAEAARGKEEDEEQQAEEGKEEEATKDEQPDNAEFGDVAEEDANVRDARTSTRQQQADTTDGTQNDNNPEDEAPYEPRDALLMATGLMQQDTAAVTGVWSFPNDGHRQLYDAFPKHRAIVRQMHGDDAWSDGTEQVTRVFLSRSPVTNKVELAGYETEDTSAAGDKPKRVFHPADKLFMSLGYMSKVRLGNGGRFLHGPWTLATGASCNVLVRKPLEARKQAAGRGTDYIPQVAMRNCHSTVIAANDTHVLLRMTVGARLGENKYSPGHVLNLLANAKRLYGDNLIGVVSVNGCPRVVNAENSGKIVRVCDDFCLAYGKGGTGMMKRYGEALVAMELLGLTHGPDVQSLYDKLPSVLNRYDWRNTIVEDRQNLVEQAIS